MALTTGMLGFNGYSVAIVVVGALAWLYMRSVSVKMDPREPPLVRSTIPYIGHLLGMLRHQFSYLIILRCASFDVHSQVCLTLAPATVQRISIRSSR